MFFLVFLASHGALRLSHQKNIVLEDLSLRQGWDQSQGREPAASQHHVLGLRHFGCFVFLQIWWRGHFHYDLGKSTWLCWCLAKRIFLCVFSPWFRKKQRRWIFNILLWAMLRRPFGRRSESFVVELLSVIPRETWTMLDDDLLHLKVHLDHRILYSQCRNNGFAEQTKSFGNEHQLKYIRKTEGPRVTPPCWFLLFLYLVIIVTLILQTRRHEPGGLLITEESDLPIRFHNHIHGGWARGQGISDREDQTTVCCWVFLPSMLWLRSILL